jgi:hypothetical protein
MTVLSLFASTASAATEEGAVEKAPPRVFGKLEMKKKADASEFRIAVGKTTYVVDAAPEEVEGMAKLARKYVTVTGEIHEAGEGVRRIVPAGKNGVASQERAAVRGVVHVHRPEKGKPTYRVVDGEVMHFVAAKDGSKFKKLVGEYVEVSSFLVADAETRILEKVKSAKRSTPPGGRVPKNGNDAVIGRWKGTQVAESPPAGSGVKAGSKFKITLDIPKKMGDTTGRIFRTYDIVGARVAKADLKKRTVTLELQYTFGSGNFTLTMEGKFDPAWKTYTGDWKASALGSGTFTLNFVEEEVAKK